MKKLSFITVCLLVSITLSAQVIAFADANFKAALINHNPVIDTNGNGEIEVSEAQAVNSLSVVSANISSLSGLENFVNVTNIICMGNQISEFPNFGLAHLETLYCAHNLISAINLENFPALSVLAIENNQLAILDVHNNHNLHYLSAGQNLLSEINLCGTAVASLECSSSPNLTNITIKNGVISQLITIAEPPIGQLSFFNCPLLAAICYDADELEAVQYGLPSTSTVTLTTDCPSDCSSLQTNTFENSSFSFSPNPAESVLNIDMGGNLTIQNIRIYNALGQLVQVISKQRSNTALIDVSNLKTGTYIIEVASDDGKTTKKFIKL